MSEENVVMMRTVHDIPDSELVERAVKSARDRTARRGVEHARWIAVMSAFGLGATFAHQLCRRFDIDPDEMVKR